MNRHETFVLPRAERRGAKGIVLALLPVAMGLVSVAFAHAFKQSLFADLHYLPLTLVLFGWLFGTAIVIAGDHETVAHLQPPAARCGLPEAGEVGGIRARDVDHGERLGRCRQHDGREQCGRPDEPARATQPAARTGSGKRDSGRRHAALLAAMDRAAPNPAPVTRRQPMRSAPRR